MGYRSDDDLEKTTIGVVVVLETRLGPVPVPFVPPSTAEYNDASHPSYPVDRPNNRIAGRHSTGRKLLVPLG